MLIGLQTSCGQDRTARRVRPNLKHFFLLPWDVLAHKIGNIRSFFHWHAKYLAHCHGHNSFSLLVPLLISLALSAAKSIETSNWLDASRAEPWPCWLADTEQIAMACEDVYTDLKELNGPLEWHGGDFQPRKKRN